MTGGESGHVRVWQIDLDPPADTLRELLDTLDDAERTRLAALVSHRSRRRFIVAHAGTRYILGGMVGRDPAGLRYRLGPWGKPELLDDPSTHHNLSHSGDLALLAVSTDRPVGIDVEWRRDSLPAESLARRYFPAAEARSVAALPMEQRPGRYQRLWTRKEACGKASGVPVMGAVTLAVDPAGVCTPAPGSAGERYGARTCWVSDYPAPDGYLAAVAMQGRRPFTVDSRSWRPDDDRMIQESVPRARQR